MNTMKKGVNSFFVSLIAIILATPLAGVNGTFTLSDSQFSSGVILDYSRSTYDVAIEFSGEDTGYESITRNEIINITFVISNLGTMDDTYDLDVTWEDDGAGWFAESEYANVSVNSQQQMNVNNSGMLMQEPMAANEGFGAFSSF